MLYGVESWPISAQMNQLINSFVTSAYRIITRVKRLDKVRNTTVLTSVCRNELIHTVHDRQLRFLGHMLRNTLSTCQYLCTISTNSRHNKTRPSSTKLRGLHREADWNEEVIIFTDTPSDVRPQPWPSGKMFGLRAVPKKSAPPKDYS